MEDEESWWDWWCLRKRDDQARRKEEGGRGRRNGVEAGGRKSREVKEDGLSTESRPGREGPLERKKGPLVPLGWHPLLI
jgi:hypothetical protein